MFYTYILLLSNGKYYVGQTNNLDSRLVRHNTGQVKSTKAHRPVELVYSEKFTTRSQSVRRETYFKKLKSHKALERIIESGDGPIV